MTTKASQSHDPSKDDEPYIKVETDVPDATFQAQFEAGMKEEQEHAATVDNDQEKVKQIVLDHLREDPLYYTHLAEIHAKVDEDLSLRKPYIVHGTTVYNEETKKPVPGGKHDTKAQAEAHARALYENVPDASKVVKLSLAELRKHCGVCPEDEAYFGAPISNEVKFDIPVGDHANEADIVAMMPQGLPPKPAVWKPEGGEMEGLRSLVGGPLYVRDEANYLLDQSLGFALVPVSYVTESNGEMGSVIFWSVGSQFAKPIDQYAPDWIEKAAVLDYIASQIDRNTGNWLTHPDDPGRMILIDNSISFPVDPSIYTDSPFAMLMKGKPLSSSSLDAIKTFIGDIATQRDLRDLVGSAATDKALACAQRLLDNGTLTVAGTADYENTTSSTFTESPAATVEFNDSDARDTTS